MGLLKPEDMKYGLIAIDNRELSEDPTAGLVMRHFCGYASPVTDADVKDFYDTIATTPEFGLMDQMEHIEVYDAPDHIIARYRDHIINGKLTEVKMTEDGKIAFDSAIGADGVMGVPPTV